MPSDSDSDNEQVHARDHAAEVALCPAAAAAQAAAAASAGRIQPGPSRSPAQVRVPRPSPRTAIAPAATATSAAAAEAAAIAVEMTARLAVGGCKPKPGHRPVSKKPAAAPGVTAAAAVSLQDGSGSAAPVAKGGQQHQPVQWDVSVQRLLCPTSANPALHLHPARRSVLVQGRGQPCPWQNTLQLLHPVSSKRQQ